MSFNGEIDHEQSFKIIHIPDKPLVPPQLQPTVNVYAAEIEPKHANTLIRKLNKLAPLENLRHVKRVRKKAIDGGKTQLSMILSMVCEDGDQLDEMPNDIIELVNSFQLSTFVTKVSKYAATSKEDWEEQCKLWPTSYHPPTYNIDGIAGFDEEDSQSVLSFMKQAIVLAKSGTHQMVNAAIIVDPSTKQVIASGRDQVLPCSNPSNKSDVEAIYSNHQMSTANCSSDEPKYLHHNAACLHPWKWAEQQVQEFSGSWHPLRHSAIVAVEYAAARDRKLFPSNGLNGDNFVQDNHMLYSTLGSPLKKHKTYLPEGASCLSITVHDVENQDSQTKDSHPDSTRPYLCTDYDIYLVWEPCAMCAMALVHQRIKRIFYAFPNPYAGALGSVHRLQGERSLNHHYAVFRVLLPEEEPLGVGGLA